jgi:NYN domain
VVFRQRATEVDQKCGGCYKACTHCKGGAKDLGGQSRDTPIANDLLELAREDEYDWAVVVSSDLQLIPVVRYLQSHGRKIIHGCFPPLAMDLTKECWASIDLRPLFSGLPGTVP